MNDLPKQPPSDKASEEPQITMNSSNEGPEKSKSNFKLIATSTGIRVSQACDRCRVKKIKCDGMTPCSNCQKVNFECKTSDKLTRRAFPKGYTENLEKLVKQLEEENQILKERIDGEKTSNEGPKNLDINTNQVSALSGVNSQLDTPLLLARQGDFDARLTLTNTPTRLEPGSQYKTIPINNPIDQIFNLDNNGVIIGNDNLNFESQVNHLLINLNLPFLKISNSHNFLLNDPNSYLFNPSYSNHNLFHNRDWEIAYNPITELPNSREEDKLPLDVYDLFIKLINNFKKLFKNKKELDQQITQFFLSYNIFIPVFEYKEFKKSYEEFHTMYPFMFTYNDATINGFNISSHDYSVVNKFMMTVIQIYAMIMMNDPTINLNLILNHDNPSYTMSNMSNMKSNDAHSLIRSLYDLLPYFNLFHVSMNQLQTYLLFFHYSLVTNNKEKSLVLSSVINSYIGILGINLNTNNLFFNDLSLSIQQRRIRVKIFWVFKVLLKCFNLKFGFKPSINTTVINPVTIDRYFQLTPAKLSSLLEPQNDPEGYDELFRALLKPSIEFLTLLNIVIPSSFSPNYYQYLKNSKDGKGQANHPPNTANQQNGSGARKPHNLDWILNDDDGDGNDGNLNYNFNQFATIDKNLENWRNSLKVKQMELLPLLQYMGLDNVSGITSNNLFHELSSNEKNSEGSHLGLSREGLVHFFNSGLPDIYTASQLIKIQLNFHYLLIRSMNYINFMVDKDLTPGYYVNIFNISQEVLQYFLLIFSHIGDFEEVNYDGSGKDSSNANHLGLRTDEDGFIVNDFSVKRQKPNSGNTKKPKSWRQIPSNPFNVMLNGLSLCIINFKKAIILQMLYLLICQLKFVKKDKIDLSKSSTVLSFSVELFIKIFINYKTRSNFEQNYVYNEKSKKRSSEDYLYNKLLSDAFKDEILKDQEQSDDEDCEDLPYDPSGMSSYSSIDWDDENLDEDLKYLKILKFLKYKNNSILDQSKQMKANEQHHSRSQSGILMPNPTSVTHHHHHHTYEGGSNLKHEQQHNPLVAEDQIVPRGHQADLNSLYVNSSAHDDMGDSKTPYLTYYTPSNAASPGTLPSNKSQISFMKIPSMNRLDYIMSPHYYPEGAHNLDSQNPNYKFPMSIAEHDTLTLPQASLLQTSGGSSSSKQTASNIQNNDNNKMNDPIIKKEKTIIGELMRGSEGNGGNKLYHNWT
ncbi:uncharacterized protein KQ657_001134 [Scheffersomyces spartinae]|uniref:Zn(2)-C6 fungal-type domain-containing protein n=1 Tax=Scheffersomyces spartinae TaxID=45513 RepID=A0A9P8AID9_9ASCO|nr:uncharacterized protein KQ657_001134 [Scheffersomyces spartinae]KAG7193020.1 hypothetical protein KQ657_001134 [Scheffersomyces spartinae]